MVVVHVMDFPGSQCQGAKWIQLPLISLNESCVSNNNDYQLLTWTVVSRVWSGRYQPQPPSPTWEKAAENGFGTHCLRRNENYKSKLERMKMIKKRKVENSKRKEKNERKMKCEKWKGLRSLLRGCLPGVGCWKNDIYCLNIKWMLIFVEKGEWTYHEHTSRSSSKTCLYKTCCLDTNIVEFALV